jgi:hypothetical protein
MSSTEPMLLPREPAPPQAHPARVRSVFGLLGGPGAWFAQLCFGDLLASGPCFSAGQRSLVPTAYLAWTWPALVTLLVVCVFVAFAAFWASWRNFRDTQQALCAGRAAGGAHFLALSGMIFGAGFCIATLLTVVPYAALPRCAG